MCLGWRRPVSFSSPCGGAASGCRYRSSLQLRACWQVEVCRRIMEAYVRERYPPTRDPLITHTLMRICRLMHDSINALSCDDEVRSIGSLICAGLIRSVEFGSDLERQLAWLVECRAAFCNIDPVLQQLVHSGLSSSITSRVDTSVCATLSVCLSACLSLSLSFWSYIFYQCRQLTDRDFDAIVLSGPSCRLPTASPGRWIGGRPPDMVASCDLSG